MYTVYNKKDFIGNKNTNNNYYTLFMIVHRTCARFHIEKNNSQSSMQVIPIQCISSYWTSTLLDILG